MKAIIIRLHMMKNRWPEAFQVIVALEEQGFESVVVGGAVRDFLLRKPVKDYDVATSATPEEVKRVFPRTIDTGLAHGTITVLMDEPIEVTTFRVETTYTDRRRPDAVQFVRHLKDDLSRRDFTINAMALTKDDQLIDYYEGKKDLDRKVIRAVGDATQRFEEDALRILRGIRFSSQLNFTLESSTEQAMHACARNLTCIAKERIKQELDRIWLSDCPEYALRYLRQPDLQAALPGQWNGLPTRERGFSSPSSGWAWYHSFQSEPIDLPFSNVEKKLIKQTMQLTRKLIDEGWSYETVFDFSDKAIYVSHEVPSTVSPFHHQVDLQTWLDSAPIRHLQDLSVSGRDLIQWVGAKQGPWVRRLQLKLAVEILQGRLQNSKVAIKEWVKTHVNETTDY